MPVQRKIVKTPGIRTKRSPLGVNQVDILDTALVCQMTDDDILGCGGIFTKKLHQDGLDFTAYGYDGGEQADDCRPEKIVVK